MQIWNEFWLSLFDGIEVKFGVAFFAAYMSLNFGANEYLLILVQYLFFADFILGVFDATKHKRFSWCCVWYGIRKITSLYFAVLVIGFGSKAFDVAISSKVEIAYNGMFFFDLFIYLLIIFELVSINKHLADLDFTVNKQIDMFWNKHNGLVKEKVEGVFRSKLEVKKDEKILPIRKNAHDKKNDEI